MYRVLSVQSPTVYSCISSNALEHEVDQPPPSSFSGSSPADASAHTFSPLHLLQPVSCLLLFSASSSRSEGSRARVAVATCPTPITR